MNNTHESDTLAFLEALAGEQTGGLGRDSWQKTGGPSPDWFTGYPADICALVAF